MWGNEDPCDANRIEKNFNYSYMADRPMPHCIYAFPRSIFKDVCHCSFFFRMMRAANATMHVPDMKQPDYVKSFL